MYFESQDADHEWEIKYPSRSHSCDRASAESIPCDLNTLPKPRSTVFAVTVRSILGQSRSRVSSLKASLAGWDGKSCGFQSVTNEAGESPVADRTVLELVEDRRERTGDSTSLPDRVSTISISSDPTFECLGTVIRPIAADSMTDSKDSGRWPHSKIYQSWTRDCQDFWISV